MDESWTEQRQKQREKQVMEKFYWEISVMHGSLGEEIEKRLDQAIDRILAAAPKSTFDAIPLVVKLIKSLINSYLSVSPETDNPSAIVVSRMCFMIEYSVKKRKMEDTEMFVYRAAVSIGDMVDNDDDFQTARWRPNRKPEYAVLVQDLPEDDFTLANAMEEFSWMTEDLPKKVDQATDRIIDWDPKSAIDAIPALVKLIRKMTKNDYPSTKEVKYCAYLIWESVLKKQAETRESRADWEWPTAEFIIQAANGIGSAASKSEKFEESSWGWKPTSVDSTHTDIKPENQANKSDRLAIFSKTPSSDHSSIRPKSPSSPQQPITLPPSTFEDFPMTSPKHALDGGHRSRLNFRRSSYKRSNNKSIAKKIKRFISRKYGLRRKSIG